MNHTTTETQALQALQTIPAGAASGTSLILSGDSMDKMFRLAEIMATGRSTVPRHLQGNVGDCMAIAMQATQWNMNPFAVAQKTHIVNGTLGYEAQLVAAAINNSRVVVDRFHFEWFGEWAKIVGKFKTVESKTKKDDDGNFKKYIVPAWEQKDEQGLGVRVWATLRGEAEPRTLELLMTQARTRNSTLWTEDPKQQIAYLAQKRWARLYAPDVILGVYTPDELVDQSPKDMGPAEVVADPEEQKLVAEATAAARKGKAEFQRWYKTVEQDKRTKLAPHRPELERVWTEADSRRTVDTPAPKPDAPKAEPQDATGPATKTLAEVLAMIEAAGNEDALNVAADWANSIPDSTGRRQAEEAYEARLATLRA